MFKLPSLQRSMTLVCSRDPALDTPPDIEDGDGATPEETAKAQAAWTEWARKIEQARETGAWASLIKDGAQPTMFEVRPFPGVPLRKLIDARSRGEIGEVECAALAFRICLIGVSNLGDAKVTKTAHSRFGDMASEDITNLLDSIEPRIVSELGNLVFQRGVSPDPKS